MYKYFFRSDERIHSRLFKAMKQYMLIFMAALLLIVAMIVPGSAVSGAGSTSITIYIIPAIHNNIIIDTDSISSMYLTNQVAVRMCRGEYKPIRVVVQSTEQITNLMAIPGNLTSAKNTISASNIDIKHIQTWYQNTTKYDGTVSQLTPELLLNNKGLIRVNAGNNEAWITNQYVSINGTTDYTYPAQYKSISSFPVQDDLSLRPVDVAKNGGTQFWVTVHVPDNAVPGEYTGKISLDASGMNYGTINLDLTVLPFTLAEYPLINNVYYDGRTSTIYPDGEIGRRYKSVTQLTAEYQNMYNHGINYPMISQLWDNETSFKTTLRIIKGIGFPTDKTFLTGKEMNLEYGYDATQAELASITSEVQTVMKWVRSVFDANCEVYFYGIDEAPAAIIAQELDEWQAIHNGGGKVFVAGRQSYMVSGGGVGLIDVFNDSTETNWAANAAVWHNAGGKYCQYSNPQCGFERPLDYRIYHIQTWQSGCDGIMDWAYQGHYGAAWEEFSSGYGHRASYMMTYPTVNGVIDTIQWEGWREGVTDLRYLATLQQTISDAKSKGKDTSAIEDWLANLKNSDLTAQDLETVRSQIITNILSLNDSDTNQSEIVQSLVLSPIGDKSVYEGELLSFTISATNSKGDNLIYYASNLPFGATFYPSMPAFSWTPVRDQVGTYTNIYFSVTDGIEIASESITITVINKPEDWDINLDNVINDLDIILIRQHWGKKGSPRWIRQDINGDGVINVLDSIIIGQHWTR